MAHAQPHGADGRAHGGHEADAAPERKAVRMADRGAQRKPIARAKHSTNQRAEPRAKRRAKRFANEVAHGHGEHAARHGCAVVDAVAAAVLRPTSATGGTGADTGTTIATEDGDAASASLTVISLAAAGGMAGLAALVVCFVRVRRKRRRKRHRRAFSAPSVLALQTAIELVPMGERERVAKPVNNEEAQGKKKAFGPPSPASRSFHEGSKRRDDGPGFRVVHALFAYAHRHVDELSFRAGEVLMLEEKRRQQQPARGAAAARRRVVLRPQRGGKERIGSLELCDGLHVARRGGRGRGGQLDEHHHGGAVQPDRERQPVLAVLPEGAGRLL